MKLSNSFYLEKSIRQKLSYTERDLPPDGMINLPDFKASRILAAKINSQIAPGKPVSGSDLYLLSLLNRLSRKLIDQYFSKTTKSDGQPMDLSEIPEFKTPENWIDYLNSLIENFPDSRLIRKDQDILTLLKTELVLNIKLTDGILVHLNNRNPACSGMSFLFTDQRLSRPIRDTILEELRGYMNASGCGITQRFDLVKMLLEPMKRYPDSLENQILFIMKEWKNLISFNPDEILTALDFHKEEHNFRGGGPGPVEGIDFTCCQEKDFANFSQDSDWMPNIILIAKNAYVWLDQLSGKYKRTISTLNEIPDEELDDLAEKGITGLWLIGLWERSIASKNIKRICGNPEAEASAYSLNRYDIAHVLGGWSALEDLKNRALYRGIRLASDMVPNHTGLDSDWVFNHPEYFLSRRDIPFPDYTFNGPNLSQDNRISLFLEDGYYSKSDAAVVFKRVDNMTGDTLYMYHGNDGTTMPWNDTAQINFLEPHIREAVIQQILHVARHFPIIRFDAAMTLASKHIQRLWYPEPGKGGAIPSRSEYAMSSNELKKKIPIEFWREVVDRIADELPDTLLLAEAFWMMEGYFVRNLGMHRVYNSAFMNLLKTENNKEFRKLLKETMDYDSKIMKRYVNFMNNPDEDTAVAQFGKGDKYFGVCTLMMTLPGLPMIGHGQFEGFEEKYGMEYKKAYWDETPDSSLLDRHRREIIPIMKKRSLFAGAKGFHLFDFISGDWNVNENVYAFTNSKNEHQTIVFYNNSYEPAEGVIQKEVPKAINNESGERIGTQTQDLQAILGLNEANYTILFDSKEGLWYIHRNSDLIREGFPIHLNGYESRVFHPVIQRQDDEKRSYEKLLRRIGKQGVPNLDKALKYAELEPAIFMIGEFFNSGIIESPEMSDMITSLSKDLNSVRKVLNKYRKQKKPVFTSMESLIVPAVQAFQLMKLDDSQLFRMARFYETFNNYQKEKPSVQFREIYLSLLKDRSFYDWFGINEHEGILWYNKERMEEAVWWFSIIGAAQFRSSANQGLSVKKELFEEFLIDLQNALGKSEYRISRVIEELDES